MRGRRSSKPAEAQNGRKVAASYGVSVHVPRAARVAFESAFESLGLAVSTAEAADGWRVTGHGAKRPAMAELALRLALAAASVGIAAPIPEIVRRTTAQWSREAGGGSFAARLGRFFVHDQAGTVRPPVNALGITLAAGMAFGSGRHETTQGVLLALDRIARRKRHVRRALDIGTGSGVLAIAIARLWRSPVIAADNDPVALAVACENARANGVAARVRIVRSEALAAPTLRRRGSFDVIVANIRARPIRAMAQALAAALAPGGRAILAGILASEAAAIARAYAGFGLRRAGVIDRGAWRTLILARA